MTNLTFLGTGGGRFATIWQARNTGGLYLESGERVHIDPGPGALIQLLKFGIDPTKTSCLIISHCHPDHYADAEVLIEAMTQGCAKKRGFVIGSESVLKGIPKFGPAISRYHQSRVGDVIIAHPGDSFKVGDITVNALPTKHSDGSGIGFSFETRDGIVTYTGDTALQGKILEFYKGSRILILSVTRPIGEEKKQLLDPDLNPLYHLCPEDAARIIGEVRPELGIITHFGMMFIKKNPEKQAQWIENETGIKTLAATDGMKIEMGKRIRIY